MFRLIFRVVCSSPPGDCNVLSLSKLVHLQSSRKLPGIGSRPPPHTLSSQRSGFQEYALLTSITVDIVAARSMQWPGPGLSTGSHVEWKEGLPPPPTPPPTVDSLVTRNGPRNIFAEGSGAGGVQTAKASRKQSSLSGKESAQGCLPKRLLGRPD